MPGDVGITLEKLFDMWQREHPSEDFPLPLPGQEDVEPFDGKTANVYIDKSSIRVEAREVDFVASTDDIDGDGDIVEQDFVFERFYKNPVILFAHDGRSLPIGKGLNTRVEGGKLRTTIRFATKRANPTAEYVFQLIREDILKAVSIGFIPRDIRLEVRDGKEIFVLSKNELIEISVVPIPSNPNALVEGKSLARKKHFNHAPPREQSEKKSAHGGEETEMNQKEFDELFAKFKELESKCKGLEVKNESLLKEHDALMERYKSLEGLYKEEKQRANEAEMANVERQLDAIVGKKIAATEKASLMKLAAANRELYDEQLKAINDRPDMNLTAQSVLPAQGASGSPPLAPSPNEKSGAEFAAIVNQAAGLSS